MDRSDLIVGRTVGGVKRAGLSLITESQKMRHCRGKDFFNRRHELGPHSRPQEPGIQIGLISSPVTAFFFKKRLKFFTPNPEQRPKHPGLLAQDARTVRLRRPRKKTPKEGFHLIIGLVRGQHPGLGMRLELLVKKLLPDLAGVILPGLPNASRRLLRLMNEDRDLELLGKLLHKSLILIGSLGPPPVIDVQDPELLGTRHSPAVLGQEQKKRGRIQPP